MDGKDAPDKADLVRRRVLQALGGGIGTAAVGCGPDGNDTAGGTGGSSAGSGGAGSSSSSSGHGGHHGHGGAGGGMEICERWLRRGAELGAIMRV